jgi:DNA-binding LacI/PurR family transcriptional regulator
MALRLTGYCLNMGFGKNRRAGMPQQRELLALTDPPTAIFAANDVMAAGVIDAVHALGLRVPDDVSVIGYDDRDMAKFLKPALTTVRLPMAQIGSTAAERLIRCVEEGASLVDSVFIRCELIVRDSCGECSRPK